MTINRMVYNALVASGKNKLNLVNEALETFSETNANNDLSNSLTQALTVAQKVLRQKQKGCVDRANAALRVAWAAASEIDV